MIEPNEINLIVSKEYKKYLQTIKWRKRKHAAWYSLFVLPIFVYVGCKYGLLIECVAIGFFILPSFAESIADVLTDKF